MVCKLGVIIDMHNFCARIYKTTCNLLPRKVVILMVHHVCVICTSVSSDPLLDLKLSCYLTISYILLVGNPYFRFTHDKLFYCLMQDNSCSIVEQWKEALESTGIQVVVGGHNSETPRGGKIN